MVIKRVFLVLGNTIKKNIDITHCGNSSRIKYQDRRTRQTSILLADKYMTTMA